MCTLKLETATVRLSHYATNEFSFSQQEVLVHVQVSYYVCPIHKSKLF